MLHKMWKEEIGPVAKEFSDDIWEKFSAATKIIHDKRNEYLEEQEKVAEKNQLMQPIMEDQGAIKQLEKLSDVVQPVESK